MEFISPFETEWLMAQNSSKMQELVDQKGSPSTAKSREKLRRMWQFAQSALHLIKINLVWSQNAQPDA